MPAESEDDEEINKEELKLKYGIDLDAAYESVSCTHRPVGGIRSISTYNEKTGEKEIMNLDKWRCDDCKYDLPEQWRVRNRLLLETIAEEFGLPLQIFPDYPDYTTETRRLTAAEVMDDIENRRNVLESFMGRSPPRNPLGSGEDFIEAVIFTGNKEKALKEIDRIISGMKK